MTRESGSKADLRILWMGIDDEVLVRRHRVHARGGVRNLSHSAVEFVLYADPTPPSHHAH